MDGSSAAERFEVSREVDAPVAAVVEVLRDPQGHVAIDSYRLEPRPGDRTRVTSYDDWSEIDPVYRGKGIFPVIPEAALRATLGILARTLQRPRTS